MSKLTLSNIANALNDNSTVNTINSNNESIETAIENTLSRDGTTPNTMSSNLDMNSNRVVNLPAPVNDSDAARKVDTEAGYGSVKYTFESSISMAQPSTGGLRFNNADVPSVSYLAVNAQSSNIGNPNVSGYITTWDDSTSPIKGQLIVTKINSPEVFVIYDVLSITNNTNWLQVEVSHRVSSGVWTASDNMAVIFYRTGDAGSGGTIDGPGTSVDSEIVLFNGTNGQLLKRATQTGILKGTSGVIGTATAGTDYYAPSGTDVAVVDGGTGASDAATARTNLGVDVAGTDNSTNVTLAGTPDYITISGQQITRNQIDLTTDVTGDLPLSEGGTGTSLSDPGADRIMCWDESGNVTAWFTPTSGLETSTTNLQVTENVKTASITFFIDGGGAVITTGIKGDLSIPFGCTIQGVRLLADQTGSIQIDIWKDTYANFPPTDADSITSSAVPAISSSNKDEDITLTGWTTSISAGDILRFNVDSVTTITRCTVALDVIKT